MLSMTRAVCLLSIYLNTMHWENFTFTFVEVILKQYCTCTHMKILFVPHREESVFALKKPVVVYRITDCYFENDMKHCVEKS